MKIVMFSNTYLPAVGGIENSVDIFSREMRRQGHAVLVVAPEYDGARSSTDEVLRVPALRQFAGSPFSINLAVPTSVLEQLAAFGPDLVHSHQPFLLGDSALRFARVHDLPIVYSNHTFMERYLHWFPVELQVLRNIAETLPVAYANLVDQVVTPTESVAKVLRERGVRTPITALPTGIDAAFYASGDRRAFRQRHGLRDTHQVIGHLGRLNPEKNLDYLCAVMLDFIAQDPARRRLLLAGEGDSVPAITRAFAEAGLAAQLVYVGLVQGQDCADAYAAMDAFIFTSLTDTQGLVLSEAMAAGNPVFALDAPGARDIIRHPQSGYLFDAATPPLAFARTLGALLDDAEALARMRETARAQARQLSIGNCTRAMLELYRSVIARVEPGGKTLSAWDRLKNRWDVEMDLVQEKLQCLLG